MMNIENWLKRQEAANATTDPPDVDGFMSLYGYALKFGVKEYGYINAIRDFCSFVPPDLESATRIVLACIFIEWLSGGPKSHAARDFIIGTCRAAMAAGV